MPAIEQIDRPTELEDEHEPDVPDVDDVFPPDDSDDDDDDGRDPSRWITVATFWQSTEAHMARLKLESEEIDCVLIDENLVAMDWLYANAVGGIKLRVPEEDAERAKQLLTDRPAPLAHTADDPPTQNETADDVWLRCPDCGSTNVDRPYFIRRNLWAVVALILLSTTILFFVLPAILVVYFIFLRPYRCKQCEEVFFSPSRKRGFDLEVREVED